MPSPHAIFAGIRKLPPGHRLVWEQGRTSVEPYWDLRFDGTDARPEGEIVEEFEERLREAVRLRLVSDVPLGAFLSGGIDSSSVVAFMCDLLPPEQVQTFSIGFTERSFDESEHARRVARHFRTQHHEEIFTPSVLLDVLPEVTAGLDEPFADPSVLPTFLLSRFARETVTVALGGDGGDELLAGYPTFPAEAVARRYVAAARPPRAGRRPARGAPAGLDRRLQLRLQGQALPARGDRARRDAAPAVARRLHDGRAAGAARRAADRRSAGRRAGALRPPADGRLGGEAHLPLREDVHDRRHPGEGRPREHAHVARGARARSSTTRSSSSSRACPRA